MKIHTANIISFFELEPEWQAEAIRNLDEYAEESMYLEPDDAHNPTEHVLTDLMEAIPYAGVHNGFTYNAIINISNNSAMLLNIDNSGETVKYIYV